MSQKIVLRQSRQRLRLLLIVGFGWCVATVHCFVLPLETIASSISKSTATPTATSLFPSSFPLHHRQKNSVRSPTSKSALSATPERTLPPPPPPLPPIVSTLSASLSPLEHWCVTHMDVWYSQSLSIKCPFFKRRTADLLDGLDVVMRFVVIRHKSLDLIGPPPGCRPRVVVAPRSSSSSSSSIRSRSSLMAPPTKARHLNWDERLAILHADWNPTSAASATTTTTSSATTTTKRSKSKIGKGYYITGRLTTNLYRDDCVFDGPDPDMPVRGLRKYLNAASQLFDHAQSTAELLSLEIVDVDVDVKEPPRPSYLEKMGMSTSNSRISSFFQNPLHFQSHFQSSSSSSSSSSLPPPPPSPKVIVATWRLQGVLHLPWKPALPVWTGTTTYHFDHDGLIDQHVESWNISVWQAFLETLTPTLAAHIWKKKTTTTTTTSAAVTAATTSAAVTATASTSTSTDSIR